MLHQVADAKFRLLTAGLCWQNMQSQILVVQIPPGVITSLGCSQKSVLTHIVANFHFPAILVLTLSLSLDSCSVTILSVSHVL